MKPFWSFLYVFFILGGFLVVSFFFGKISLPGIGQYQSNIETTGNEEKSIITDSIANGIFDSLTTKTPEFRDSLQMSTNSGTTEINGIQFPSGDAAILNSFFGKLDTLNKFQSPLRIVYFGDSQIEGDRITSTIRKQFQQKFGGAGIGLIAPDLLYNNSHSFTVERSENWKNIDFLNLNDRVKNQSLVFKTAVLPPNEEGWFKIRQIRSKENKNDYLQLKIFFHSPGDFNITVKEDGKVIYKENVVKTTSVSVLNFDFNFTPASTELYFQSTDSLEITAFSLETKSGIQVDNIALRGQSFPPFSKSDEQAMKETVKLINPGLCLLHYGVNIAPDIRDDYDYYQTRLIGEIKKMQQLMPRVPILIVGISDMARKENGEIVSYPNIKAIKEAQMNVARACNCAFWDLEAFMGGAGSMARWVNASPRLGQKDYVHFSPEGTEKVGARLSELILGEYQKYLNTQSVR